MGLETKVTMVTTYVPPSLSTEYTNMRCSADANIEGIKAVIDVARERIDVESWR